MPLGFKRHMHVDFSLLPTLRRQPCAVSLPLLFKLFKVKNPVCKARFSKTKISSWLKQMVPKLMVNKWKVPKGQKKKIWKKKILMVSAGKFISVHLTQSPVTEILIRMALNPTALKNTPPPFAAEAKYHLATSVERDILTLNKIFLKNNYCHIFF